LAILSTAAAYKLLLYATKTQPAAIIAISADFKIALQKNNYSSFYDEHRQLWSVLFDTDALLAAFATHITLAKVNLELESSHKLTTHFKQDLNFNESPQADLKATASDSIEIETIVTVLKEARLESTIENTHGSPLKVRLGRNKFPKLLEGMLVGMRQGDRKLFVLDGKSLQPFYQGTIQEDSVVFYDVKVLRIKKSMDKKDRSESNASEVEIVLPEFSPLSDTSSVRDRTESVRDKTQKISSQLNDTKLEKAKLISRIAKMGQQMMPKSGEAEAVGSDVGESLEEAEVDGSTRAFVVQQQAQMRLMQQQQEHYQQMVMQNQLMQQQTGLFQAPQQQQLGNVNSKWGGRGK